MKGLPLILSGILLLLIGIRPVEAQLISGEAYMQGEFIEVGVSSGGVFGTARNPPEGYHPRANRNGLGFVADANQDGWDAGTPNYCGDYFVPGTPEEGWGIEVGGVNYGNFTPQFAYNASANVPGSITDYATMSGTVSVTWTGSKAGLTIEKITFFPENALYFVTQVIITNNSTSNADDVYYFRNVDPDNEQPLTGNYSTLNDIISQPSADNARALVQATGLSFGCYIGLGTLDRRARVTFGGFSNRSASAVYEGNAGLSQSGSGTADAAISLAFFLGDIPAGESASFSYAYILEEGQLEAALDQTEAPIIRANGENIARTGNTIETCKGEVVNFTIVNGEDYSWTWSPSEGLSETTGTEVTATPDQTTTYTIRGTNGSDVISTEVTVALYPFVTLPEEELLPYRGSVTLEASEGFDAYAWNDDASSTTRSIEVSEAGVYTVTATDDETGCITSASVTVVAIVPTTLTLEPEAVEVEAGQEVCITGTVLDQFGDPLEGVEVFTEIDGEAVGSGISDENGEVEYCFTPTEDGIVNVVCYYEDGERVTAEVTVTDDGSGGGGDPVPSSLTLEPEEVTVVVREEVCIIGTVFDESDNPLEGVEVFTEVNGEMVGSGVSDENGEVEYCFTPGEAGVITVVCYYEDGERIESIVTVTLSPPPFTTWNGSAWSDGVPDADKDAVIAGDYISSNDLEGALLTTKSLTINSGVRVVFGAGTSLVCKADCDNQGTLVMESGSCLITEGAVSGEVQIIRNTPFDKNTFKYSVMSTPVATATNRDLGIVYAVDETQGKYNRVRGNLEVGKGYFSAKTGTVTFTGVPNTGDITVEGLTYTEGVAPVFKGYNLVGNPYPCAISADEFLDENSGELKPFVWLWNNKLPNDDRLTGGDYLLYDRDLGVVSGGEGTSFNGFIGTAQGFMVQLKSAAVSPASVAFKGDMRRTGQNSDDAFLRMANRQTKIQRLKLAVRNDQGQYDETLVALSADATADYDQRYDIHKLKGFAPDNNPSALWLSTQLAGAEMITQGLPLLEDEESIEIPLNVETGSLGQLELSIAEKLLPDDVNVYLKDLFSDEIHNLQEPYSYLAQEKQTTDRFRLLLSVGKLPVSEEVLGSQGVGVFAGASELKLWFQENLRRGKVTVLDPLGRTVAFFENITTRNRKLTLPVQTAADQLYILKIESQGNAYTRKFVKHSK